MVTGSTHRLGGVLDLVFTDVPDLCKVSVAVPIGRSDHSHACLELEITSTLPGFDVACDVPLKIRVNWDAVRAKVIELPWQSIYRSDDPVDVLNHNLNGLLDFYIPKSRLLESDMAIDHVSMRHAELLSKESRLLITVGDMLVQM